MSIFRVSKAEAVYFDLFTQFADKAHESAVALETLVNNYTDVDTQVCGIREIEHDCDKLVHAIMSKLNKSFVTPLDREDIDHIAKFMDNVVDQVEAAAQCFSTYNVTVIREQAKDLSAVITKSTALLQLLFIELKRMKKSTTLHKHIIEINSLENEGDIIYRDALCDLFRNEKDPIEVIKWKDLYELLENATDACEDVANIVEGVVMKHA